MAPKPPFKPAKDLSRVDLVPAYFRNMIFARGTECTWQQSRRCPCQTKVSDGNADTDTDKQPTGEPDIQCAECFGKGFLYEDGQDIVAIVLGASKNPLFYQLYGERARGMCSVTVPAEVMLRAWDRITVNSSVVPIDETRIRTGSTERCRYPIASKTLQLGRSTVLPSELVEEESNGTSIRRADADGVAISTTLVEGTDYEIVDGQIVWINAGSLSNGIFIISGDFDDGTVIPEGTLLPGSGILTPLPGYVTTADGIVIAGTVAVPAIAKAIGTSYNIVGGTKIITTIDSVAVEAEAMTLFTGGTNDGVGGNIPAVGESFTITYWAHPTYIVQDMPHLHRDTIIALKNPGGKVSNLPLQVHCWLESLGPPHGYEVA